VKVSCGLGGDEPASDIIDVINDFDGGVLAGYAGAGRDHFCEAAIRRNLLFDPNTDLLEDLAPGDPLARQELRVSADDDPTVWAAMPAKRSLTNCSLEIATTLLSIIATTSGAVPVRPRYHGSSPRQTRGLFLLQLGNRVRARSASRSLLPIP
jgi:hypothetical protein